MGLLSNKIRREQLNPGDHIYTWRNGYSYSHHGIYVGDGKVIHLTRAPGLIIFSSSNDSSPSHPSADRVVCCSIEEFLSGGDLNLYEYGVKRALFLIKRGGTCTCTSSDPPKDVLHRAFILLEKGFGGYNLFNSNCEDFATYCKTGLLNVDMSMAGRSGQIKFPYAIFLAVIITPYQFLSTDLICLALLVCGLYCGFIFALDRGVEKVAVEKFDFRYQLTVKMEDGTTRRSLPVGQYIAYIIWVLRFWSWAPTSGILLWIRSVLLYQTLFCFVLEHLRNHQTNLKLGEYVGWIIWVLGYWYWSSESRIYFWTKLGFLYFSLSLFVSDHLRRLKLGKYIFQTAFILGYWYGTPESTIILWIRLLLFYKALLMFVPDDLPRKRHLKLYRLFGACFAIHSAALVLGLDYRDNFFRIYKDYFL